MISLIAIFVGAMALYSLDKDIQESSCMRKYNFEKLHEVSFESENNPIIEELSDSECKQRSVTYKKVMQAIEFLEKQKNIKPVSRKLQQSDISDDLVSLHKNNDRVEPVFQRQDKACKKIIEKDPKSYYRPIIKNPSHR